MITKAISRLAVATILTTVAFAIGCGGGTPAKAPGTNPEDMTPEGHEAAAQAEEQKAAGHEQDKENVPHSKPMMEDTQKAQHEQQAEEHRDVADQHRKAGEAAEQQKK